MDNVDFYKKWKKVYADGIDADTWGQSIEAIEEYEKLNNLIEAQMPSMSLSVDERSVLLKVRHATALRCESLQELNADKKISLDKMKTIQQVMTDLANGRTVSKFPVVMPSFSVAEVEKKKKTVFGDDDDDTKENADNTAGKTVGTLLSPPANVAPGLTTFSINVKKIGLKDAQTYINPFITVSVVGPDHKVVMSQDTPFSTFLKPTYVMFDQLCHIHTPVEEMAMGYSVFFEFKHYKPSKSKISTRCFAFMEYDELLQSEGRQVCLELYKKPTDLSRRYLSLFTVKKLYLHVETTFNKH